jgi:hypothetical protein
LGATLGAEFASEKKWCGPYATPNQRHMDFALIFRDQEVDGSNPFAPTTSQTLTHDFWFFVYTTVDDFVGGQILKVHHVRISAWYDLAQCSDAGSIP